MTGQQPTIRRTLTSVYVATDNSGRVLAVWRRQPNREEECEVFGLSPEADLGNARGWARWMPASSLTDDDLAMLID